MSNSKTLHVLIVDDEADVVRFLSMALEDAGFSVSTASNGVEALKKLNKKIPDLISLDVIMPGGSGVKFSRELKKNPAWSKIPVLIVTGHARDELGKADFKEMTMSGPGVYLEKPVTAEKYVRVIKQILNVDKHNGDNAASSIKDEAKALLDSMDDQTLKEVLKILKSKK